MTELTYARRSARVLLLDAADRLLLLHEIYPHQLAPLVSYRRTPNGGVVTLGRISCAGR